MRPHYTEQEAREKLCPLRVSAMIPLCVQAELNGASHDQVKKFGGPAMCCDASACMWWGWQGGGREKGRCDATGLCG